MIGQHKNREIIDKWYKTDSFPRFLVITGGKGSGKSVMADYIVNKLNYNCVYCSLSIDNVREIINQAYACIAPTVYVFLNAHKMSLQAKSALLKVTEEPPNKAVFILTSLSMESLLHTLQSRCTELKMSAYSKDELREYNDTEFVKYADCPGDLDIMLNSDMDKYLQFCDDIISACCGGQYEKCLPLTNKIKKSDNDDTGFDGELILKLLQHKLFMMCYDTQNFIYASMICDVVETAHQLNQYNISIRMQFDKMLFSMCDKVNSSNTDISR